MNKKQFATKLIASMLSAYFLVPCTSTFGVDSQPESEEAVSLSEKNQEALNDEDTQESEDAQEDEDEQEEEDMQEDEDEQEEEDTKEDENKQKSEDTQKVKDKKKGQKKTILRNPYVQVVGGGIGLGALIFGGSRLWKRFSSGRHPQSPADGGSVTPPAAPVEPQTLPEDRSGWNNLHHAAENEQNATVLYDLEPAQKKACFEARDALGRTPLYIAFKYNQSIFLDHFSNEYNFRQLYPQSSQEMYNFFIFDVLCTAARLNDVHTLSHLREAIRSTFAYRKASTDPHDYSLLNMALAHGAQIAHERSLNLGITELGYSLLDIALRHNARNAATYLMGQGVVFEMNNIFGNAAFTPEDKLTFLNLLAEHGYSFAGTDGHDPFDVRLVFGDATLTPENKLEILNFLAERGRRFADSDDRKNFITQIFDDQSLSDHDQLEILRSLKNRGFDFDINGMRCPMSHACSNLAVAASKPVLFKFYIEDCNALSYMDANDRNMVRRVINVIGNTDTKTMISTYFENKCREQPDAPIAQPDATAAGASTQLGAPNAQPGTMAAGEGSGSETTTEGTPPNQGHTTGSSDAQPSRPLTREEMRAQQLAALARRRNNNT